MLRKYHVWGFIVLAFFCAKSYACADIGCDRTRGTIFFRGYQSCESVPFLSPSNDTRLNLELLLIDAGKLTGTLNRSQDNLPSQDLVSLVVPFDFEDWQPLEPTPGAATDTGSTKKAEQANDFAQGEGSRCRNAGDGLEAFKNAVNAAVKLPKEEAAILIAARGALDINCDTANKSDWTAPHEIHSALGHEFAVYIAGANAFYAGDFTTALKDFNSLKNSANPWLQETSSYMAARTLLNSAQSQAFGEWGELKLDKVDKDRLQDAAEAFDSYLDEFPHGMYAASARGLLRRVYWLGGDQTKLAAAFDSALADAKDGANNVTLLELVQEADSKLLGSVKVDQVKSPRFLAIVDLMQMRSDDDQATDSAAKSALKLADLEAQKDRFASHPELYNYLLAAFHLYAESQPEKALALLPDPAGSQLSYFAFSEQTLRVMALEAGKQYDAERKLLLQLLPLAKLPLQSEQLQLQLARLEERTGHVDRVFAPGSPVHDKTIRTILVEYSASADQLRQRIKDTNEDAGVANAALYSLLYKELTGSKYQAFQSDLALLPAHPSELLAPFVAAGDSTSNGYHCPSLREVAAALQRDGSDAQSLNCVGELVRNHGVHYGQDAAPQKTDLGGSDSIFPVTKYSRLDAYLNIIANTQAPGDARAYALYRAVRCYAPAGNNDCGTQDIPQSTRKQWYQTLHKEYPDSSWAKSLKYYW